VFNALMKGEKLNPDKIWKKNVVVNGLFGNKKTVPITKKLEAEI
jgi:hypothetical protein